MSNAEKRIWVGCLAAYNNGTHHGEWLDLDGKSYEEVMDEIRKILRTSPNPNVVRQDFRCPQGHLSTRDINEPAQMPRECPTCGEEAIAEGSAYQSSEEWHICDHEGFSGITIDRYHDIEKVVELANLLEEHGEPFRALVDHHGASDIEYCLKQFEEGFCGQFDSPADYAEQTTRDCQEVPEFLNFYVDWEKMANDMQYGGDVLFLEGDSGGVFVFNNHI